MKRCFLALLFVACLIPSGVVSAAQMHKIGFVDFEQVFNEFYRTKEENLLLQNEKQRKEEEGQLIVDQINKLKDEAELLSDDAKMQKEQEIKKKIAQLKNFEKEARGTLLRKRNALWKSIFKDIKSFVAEKAKKEGYSFVIDERALLYYDATYDITDIVIKELNQQKGK